MLTAVPPLVLHPYYKLKYIEHQWGGEAEYLADVAAGHANARNWIAHARSVVEAAVRVSESPLTT